MEELSGLDARFLYSETPTAHMHTLKVVVVDIAGREESLTPEVLAASLAERLDRMPGFRRQVVPVPHQISHPVWVETPFSPEDHIRWRHVGPNGDRRSLAALVAEVAELPLARDRPLWEIVVVDGLAGGRIAFVVKLHHALADGVAAAAMLENIFQDDPERAVVAPADPEPVPSPALLRRHAWRSRLRRMRRLPHLGSEIASRVRSARRSRRRLAVQPASVFSGRRTCLNRSLSARRTFAVTDLPMADVLAITRARQVTVNDVYLAICAGALRRLLGTEATSRGGLVVGVPIGVPGDAIRLTGNRLDHMVVSLRTDLDDPLDRLFAISASAAAGRAERAALGPSLFEERAAHTPPALYRTAVRLWVSTRLADHVRPPINLIASNVAGPRRPLELDGGVATELWSVGPILEGIGLNLTAWSYAGTLRVAALACPESLPDPWELMGHLDASFDELVAATAVGHR